MGKQATAAAARWRLRVHAEGARGIKAASGLVTFDAKPDPYVILAFNGVTKQCAPVQDVPPVEYFAWPDAIVEFDVSDETALLQAALVVHVKDSDTIKDRYIGGTSIPLAPMCAGTQGDPRVLCQGKFFTLDFEDEKLKKKKPSGEVKLTMTVIDTMRNTAPEPTTMMGQSGVEQARDAKAVPTITAPPTGMLAVIPVEEKSESSLQAAAEVAVATDPVREREPSAAPAKILSPALANAAATVSVDVESNANVEDNISGKTVETSGISTPPQGPVASPKNAATVNVKTLKVELISARNLTRPTSVGALFDRKPDPLVTIEMYGLTKTSVALKDADLKKPVEWMGVTLAFDLPHTSPPSSKRKGGGPLDLIVHVKDENLMKATYMGGGKIDMSEFFEARSDETGWCWQTPAANCEVAQERIVMLTHSDERLSKKKACGEITLRFHFEAEPIEAPINNEATPETTSIKAEEPPISLAPTESDVDRATVQNETRASVMPEVPSTPKLNRHGDVKMLSVELLSGRGLSKPSTGNLAKSMLKSLLDRKPDPYVVMVLGTQTRKCPAVNDVDVAFFEWKNAVQVFEFTSKPYPDTLFVHVRDDDVAGSDPYMGGARILMKEIWDEALARATCDPPGDPQVVKTYPLTFTDEKMIKQKDCGFVTARFRWIYSDMELPIVATPGPDSSSLSDQADAPEPLKPVPPLKSRTGFVILRELALSSNAQVLDSSLDLYLEASCPSINDAAFTKKDPTNQHTYSAKSSVLTDAMKGKDASQTVKIEWVGDELIVPVCAPLDGENPDDVEIHVRLKDKNAIMKDAEIATKRFRLKDHAVNFSDYQPISATIELEPSGRQLKSTKSMLALGVDLQFLPHDSPLLSATSTAPQGGLVTIFLLRGVLSPSIPPTMKPLSTASLSLAIDCLATKKTGMMAFGKFPVTEVYSPSVSAGELYEHGQSVIGWWSTCNFAVSNKQCIASKEKESFVLEMSVRMKSDKSEKVIGSLQFNGFAAAFTPSSAIHSKTIHFGALGSMILEFVAAFRTLADESVTNKSPKPVAPPVPSGYLHLLILHAKSLISPDPKGEEVEDLDPEVRVSIEPKYIKRKENPVRSMLKTKPLENAGAVPTWNEYLRLEYQLPPAPMLPPDSTLDHRRASEAENAIKYPPPVVQIGVFDIQMPGEKNGVQAIGKAELPLSAFLLGTSTTSDGMATSAAEPIQLSVDIYLAGKKTGILVFEGIFEPAPSEFKAPVDGVAHAYRQQCRSVGRELRERSKKLKSGEMNLTTARLLSNSNRKHGVAGRLEVHLVGYRSRQSNLAANDFGVSAHIWMSSSVDDRREVKSKLRVTEDLADECQVVWDARLTLFTSDITTEMLRSEVLTLTGKQIGSLKLPLGGLLERGHVGRAQREWHALIEPTAKKSTSSSKSTPRADEVLLGLTFFADQVIFDPLFVSTEVPTDSSVVVAVNCGKVIVLDGGALDAAEIACKCSLLGDTSLEPASSKLQGTEQRTGFKMCAGVVGMDGKSLLTSCWSEQVKLDVGRSARGFITQSFARGAQPAMRFELLTKRQGARFPEPLGMLTLSLVSLLQFFNRKAARWLKMCTEGKSDDIDQVRIGALLEVEIAVFSSNTAIFSALKEVKLLRQAFEDMPRLETVPGVLCLRFLVGRNLIDVDANGKQDPYIIAKIIPISPISAALPSTCQTGVSIDGGRHPTWNTSIFELSVQDLLTDYVRLEVIDSNQEDHLPDASIGTADIALVSLFREHFVIPTDDSTPVWQIPKTRWLEAWIPVHSATPAGDDDSNAGDIRMEFRFLTNEYYETVRRQQIDAESVTSPYASVDLVTSPARGTLCIHIARAFNLPCTPGVQPGVRVASLGNETSQLTKPGKKSIVDPVWDGEFVEFPWPSDATTSVVGDISENLIKVEVVDLAVRTANANTLAVVAFGKLDVSSFFAHPLARSYHVYPLHGRKPPDKGEQNPSILVGCQFVPEGKEKENTIASQQPHKRDEKRNGNLHVRCAQLRLDISSYLSSIPLDATFTIRMRCCWSKGTTSSDDFKTVEIPIISLSDLVHKNGVIELTGDKTSMLFKYAGEAISPDSLVVPNPILVGELITKSDTVMAEFEVPVFDYVLFDGHLGSAWYTVLLNDSAGSLTPKLGEVRIEVQFLPVLTAPPLLVRSSSSSGEEVPGVSLFGIVVKQITGWPKATCCIVAVDLLGCSVETKPNLLNAAQHSVLSWNEVLDLAVPKATMQTDIASAIMKVAVRDAADSSIVSGSSNWIVPRELFASDGSLIANSGDIVIPIHLPVGLDNNPKSKTNGPLPELTFQLIRTGSLAASGTTNISCRKRGLFYIQVTGDGDSNLQHAKAVLVPASRVETVSRANDVSWVELTTSDRRVVPLYAGAAVETQSLLISSNDSNHQSESDAMAVLDGSLLISIVKNPATETFHRLVARSSKGDKREPITCRLMYLDAMQGQLQLQLDSVKWVANQGNSEKAPGTFRLELRLLSGVLQRWVSSPLGFWSKKTNNISWRAGKNEIVISYANADEQIEPAVQLVLVQVSDNCASKKEAFGQITVLTAIVSGATGGDAWIPGTAELTVIGTETAKATVQLSLRLRFVREEVSFEELEAKLAIEREKKALELAEGTAVLKKAFAVVGGDEHTSISIANFMKHVKNAAKPSERSDDNSAMRALEVLQHAADIETDGDLDRLFGLMDVNGDGQISWDEYVEHMQNIHALADFAAMQTIQQKAEVTRSVPNEAAVSEPEQSEDSGNTVDEDRAGEGQDNDSDLDDHRIVDMPAKPMQADTGTQGIQDIYSVSPLTREVAREGETTSRKTSTERLQVSRLVDRVTGLSEPPSAGVLQIVTREARSNSIQLTGKRREESARAKKKLPVLSTNVLDWKVDEVVQWMEHEMELSQYTQAIQQNSINGKLLLTLSDKELESELGVTAVLHKRKITNQIREFQERFQYPLPEPLPTERRRPSSGKKRGSAMIATSATVSETPAFIKREQLVFQEKLRAKQAGSENVTQQKMLGQSRCFPSTTKLVDKEPNATRSASAVASCTLTTNASNNSVETKESYSDAMADIFEAIHPDLPPIPASTSSSLRQTNLPQLPLIQVGSITNTDELFEIVRQRIHQLSQLLLPLANERKETWSDFGDDPDDDDGDQVDAPSEEQTGLHLVFDAFRRLRPSASTERISRLRFQEGMADLLSIEVSWHQFDLLFRRLDVDGDSELCWDEFHHNFTRRHISFEREDLLVLQDALVDFAMARLDSQQWTLSDLFKAFDRDGGGSVSIAEFATLVRFLFTSSTQVKRFQQQAKHKISKRHVYLLMSCLDVSADRRISHQEFLRFFFIVWSSKLMEVQDQLMALEAAAHPHEDDDELCSSLRQTKRTLRRALRTNFSRPFRDAMRCLDVSVPGPFSGLLARLQLTTDTTAHADPPAIHGQLPVPQDAARNSQDGSLQVWQVLRGMTAAHSRQDPQSLSRLRASREQTAREASRLRVQKGRNEVQRTRLTRQREPTRADAVLQTPSRHVALDRDATLKFDFRPG